MFTKCLLSYTNEPFNIIYVRFIDIGAIVDHTCSHFLFINHSYETTVPDIYLLFELSTE